MSDKPTAKPCPFCGGNPAVTHDRKCWAQCRSHGCPIVDIWIELDQWNTRAEAHSDELARVRVKLVMARDYHQTSGGITRNIHQSFAREIDAILSTLPPTDSAEKLLCDCPHCEYCRKSESPENTQ